MIVRGKICKVLAREDSIHGINIELDLNDREMCVIGEGVIISDRGD